MRRDFLALLLFLLGFLGLLFGWPRLQELWSGRVTVTQARTAPDLPEPVTRTASQDEPVTAEAVLELEIEADPAVSDPFVAEALRMMDSDPEAAMEWVTDTSRHDARIDQVVLAVRELSREWAATDPEAALPWIESRLDINRVESIGIAVATWASTDPQAAAAWVEGMTYDGAMQEAASQLASAWVARDPIAAGRWIDTLPAGSLREEAAASMVDAWSATDLPSAALWALEEARSAGSRTPFLESLSQLAVSDRPAGNFPSGLDMALELVADLPAGAFADEAAETVLSTLAQLSANENLADQILFNEATDAPGFRLFPNQEPTTLARIYMREWAYADSVAASRKLSTLEDGEIRDSAIAGFTDSIAYYDPQVATEWANSIADPQLRITSLEQTVGSMAATGSPLEAFQWMEDAGIEQELRDHLGDVIYQVLAGEAAPPGPGGPSIPVVLGD